MGRLRTVFWYGFIGLICGTGSTFSYYIASDVVPGPYGPIETYPMDLKWLELDTAAACIVAIIFAPLYVITLATLQRLSGVGVASRRVILAIAFYATLIQVVATVCTDAFTRSKFGWSLDQSISLPLAIGGATLPGLIVASILLLRWRRNIETA